MTRGGLINNGCVEHVLEETQGAVAPVLVEEEDCQPLRVEISKPPAILDLGGWLAVVNYHCVGYRTVFYQRSFRSILSTGNILVFVLWFSIKNTYNRPAWPTVIPF